MPQTLLDTPPAANGLTASRRMPRCARVFLIAAVLCGALFSSARAFAQRATPSEELETVTEKAFDAFEKKDYASAEQHLRRLIELDPHNFVPRYNLACALSMQGQATEAVSALLDAIGRGFVDLRQLRADPYLQGVRATPEFQRLLANWPEVLERHRGAITETAKRQFPGPYTITPDENLRMIYYSAFNQKTFDEARAEITRLAAWGAKNVFTEAAPDDPALAKPAWVVVVLPTRKDFMAWLFAKYGQNAITGGHSIGGAYSHDDKRLISQDLGSGLRHEFFHVLHWRSNTRLGQVHPPWVQEGLCSLVEDYDVNAAGDIKPTPSWRTNIAKRLERAGQLMPIEQLIKLDRRRFTGSRPLAMYAQGRTIFLFLYDKGKLAEWYSTYCRTFAEDPTGAKAFTEVFGKPLNEIHKDFRAYVRALPAVPEEIEPGRASLGIEVEAGSGEGLTVVQVVGSRSRDAKGRGLIKGDLITAINNRPTREMAELVRVLSDYQPGEQVEIAFRRGNQEMATTMTLVAKQ